MNRRLLAALAVVAAAVLYAKQPRFDLSFRDGESSRAFKLEIDARAMGLSLGLSF